MNEDYNNKFRDTAPIIGENVVNQQSLNKFMTGVFGWMFLGLLITAAAAFAFIVALSISPILQNMFKSNILYFVLIIGEFALVISLCKGLDKISPSTAKLMYVVYAALNGVTLSCILVSYAPVAIFLAFIMSAVFFGVMALFGIFTKTDLTSAGKIFTACLIAIIIASFVNIFMRSPGLDYIICIIGVAVFAGLTAHDTQKIKQYFYSYATASGQDVASKISIIGALMLYLDFINLFLFVVRLLGRKR